MPSPDETARELGAEVRKAAHPLQRSDDLDVLLERVGNARVVMLGEASHGTSEYYTWRSRITQRLVLELGFSFVAVEGDWPDCYVVNRHVKGYPDAGTDTALALRTFERWPTWMWANWEVVALCIWLRRHNQRLPTERRIGFYGLDVYSLWTSLAEIMRYLEDHDSAALEAAREAYACFEPFGRDVQAYARSTAFVPQSCEDEVVDLLATVRRRQSPRPDDDEARFNAEQNARTAVGAERYYRAMVRAGPDSWNVRDRHMDETLAALLHRHGRHAKAVVWEHNTHIGDARATDMAAAGMVNVGQLARERFGRDAVVLVGFGSHRGSVIAGRSWGAPMERMAMPPARAGSWDDVLHQSLEGDGLLLTDRLPEAAAQPRGQRAIGVVYDPGAERHGNYVSTRLPERYDAFVYLDHTQALHPLGVAPESTRPPATYPWGL